MAGISVLRMDEKEERKMMDITFVVLSYNQERQIIEALESIKYQVQHYLMQKKVQLIISDDCSTDRTAFYAQKWAESNQNLFAQIDILVAERNVGICQNIGKAFRLIQADRFVDLAADDIISNVDVFSIMCRYTKDTLVACMPDCFSGTQIIRDRERYREGMVAYFYTKEQLAESSRRDSAIVNGGFYSSELLNEDILAFTEKFQMLDDQARYFYMLANNENIKYDFCKEPILLYRVSEQQVTNKKGRVWKIIIKDKQKLIKYTIKAEPKLKNKISIFLSYIAMKYPYIYSHIFVPIDSALYRDRNILEHYNEQIEEMIDDRLKNGRISEKERYINDICNKALLFCAGYEVG